MNVFVVTVDHLHIGFLGCYGNTWAETPEFDRFAAEGIVFDQCFTPTLDPMEHFPALWWQAKHPLAANVAFENVFGHVQPAIFISDDATVSEAAENFFSEVIALESARASIPSEEIEGTHLALCSAVLAEVLEPLCQAQQPWLLWLHLRSLADSWDAPIQLREQLQEDEEELVYSSAQPPELEVTAQTDPDELLSYQRAYAAQVMTLDACLGPVFALVREIQTPTATILAGTRGYPLGEHKQVGGLQTALYEESTHLPLIVRFPEQRCARIPALVQPQDLLPTLCELWDIPTTQRFDATSLLGLMRYETDSIRDRIVAVSSEQITIRTRNWLMMQEQHEAGAPQLYVKPDDRWERNEIGDRVPNVAEAMQQALDEWRDHAATSSLKALPSLDSVLLQPPE